MAIMILPFPDKIMNIRKLAHNLWNSLSESSAWCVPHIRQQPNKYRGEVAMNEPKLSHSTDYRPGRSFCVFGWFEEDKYTMSCCPLVKSSIPITYERHEATCHCYMLSKIFQWQHWPRPKRSNHCKQCAQIKSSGGGIWPHQRCWEASKKPFCSVHHIFIRRDVCDWTKPAELTWLTPRSAQTILNHDLFFVTKQTISKSPKQAGSPLPPASTAPPPPRRRCVVHAPLTCHAV